jgi:hypothetical protein
VDQLQNLTAFTPEIQIQSKKGIPSLNEYNVKNTDQLYNICFNLDTNSKDFSKLEELVVEIEVNGNDEYMD